MSQYFSRTQTNTTVGNINARGSRTGVLLPPTHLSVCIQRVQHGGRRQKVSGAQILGAALLEPQLLRFGEKLAAVRRDNIALPPECRAQRPHGWSDPKRARLLDVLHHPSRLKAPPPPKAVNTSPPCLSHLRPNVAAAVDVKCRLLKCGRVPCEWAADVTVNDGSMSDIGWVNEDRIDCFHGLFPCTGQN